MTIQLEPCFAYTCPVCGERNYAEAVEPETDVSKFFDNLAGGKWMVAPDSVTCLHCTAEFETYDGEDDEV